MSWEFGLLLAAGALAGGFINGLAGFGTALLTLGFWLQIMPARQAVAVTLVMAVASGAQGMWVVRGDITRTADRLLRFLLPGLIGLPLGVAALNYINAGLLKLVIAAILLLYGSFFAFRRNLPRVSRATPGLDRGIGFVGGVLGGAASLSGAIPTMWFAMQPWSKGETRAVLQPYNFAILSLALLGLAYQGAYDRETLVLVSMALPICMSGAYLGIKIFKTLNDSQFQRLLIVGMLSTGVILGLNVALWG